jgi:hypothetical protein
MDINALTQPRLVSEQPFQPGVKGAGKRVGERRQQDPGVRMRARQMGRSVESNDGLAGTGGTGDACGAVVNPLDPFLLLRVKEDRPLVPRKVERALQLLDVRHHPEAPQCIRMLERGRRDNGNRRHSRLPACRELEQRFGRFRR